MNANCVHEVETWNSDAASLLLSGLRPRQLHVESVLTGHSSGRLFVDRPACPTAAVLLAGEGCYVGGAPGDRFLKGVNAFLSRDRCTAIFFAPDVPSRALEVLADGLYMSRAVRWHGRLRTVPGETPAQRDGVSIVPIDAEILASHLEGVHEVRETILREWKTLPLFLDRGLGSVAVAERRIVGCVTTDYVVGHSCELGVWVSSDHRLRGIGTAVAAATARQARSRGLHEVSWHCWANNVGSIGVATNVGFEPTGCYEILFDHWAAENIENMSADEYRAFALDYERRFAARPPQDSGYPHVVAATAWSLAGEGEKCRESIRAAVDMGWLRGIAQLRALWPELLESERVWANPAWRELLGRLDPEPDAAARVESGRGRDSRGDSGERRDEAKRS